MEIDGDEPPEFLLCGDLKPEELEALAKEWLTQEKAPGVLAAIEGGTYQPTIWLPWQQKAKSDTSKNPGLGWGPADTGDRDDRNIVS